MLRWYCCLIVALALGSISGCGSARASDSAPFSRESFPIGSSGSACEAQGVALGDARRSIFDRKWVLLCRDIASPVGTAYALRGGVPGLELAQRQRGVTLECAEEGGVEVAGVGLARMRNCRDRETGMAWVIYVFESGRTLFAVEGYAGYDSALRLTLASLVNNAIMPGEVSVATLGTGETTMLTRARAMASDIDSVIGRGYRDNSAGAYVEAAELFASAPALLNAADTQSGDNAARLHEIIVNRALQLSNVGQFDQAAQLFEQARTFATQDPVQARLARNFEAIDALNRGDLEAVEAILARPMPEIAGPSPAEDNTIVIDRVTAAGLNAGNGAALAGLLGQDSRLSPMERAAIIDAQALQLKGSALRLAGNNEAARALFIRAHDDTIKVREGRVVSIARLRAQILSELALVDEREGRFAEAERLLREGVMLVESQYPDSASVNAMRARLAGFLLRRQRSEEAAQLYRKIVEAVAQERTALVGLANLMQPWFDLLSGKALSDPDAARELFTASQLVERPGAADSLVQLARQLEGGSDEASELFRRSLNINRELERTRIGLARANAIAAQGGNPEGIEELQTAYDRLIAAQAQAMEALSRFPQYRAVARRSVTMDELLAALGPDEAYLKLARLGDALYASYVSPRVSRGWKIDRSANDIAEEVALLRESISVSVNGSQLTYPFDIDRAAALYDSLLGPVAEELASVRHLIFEPDGALLQLPITLLTGDRVGIASYHARVAAGGDEYDFTGIEWLGRGRAVSTALSAAGFRNARSVPASKASRAYIGLGQNVPIGPTLPERISRGAGNDMLAASCQWPAQVWNRPISATELADAATALREGRPELLTGHAFSDSAIMARGDLDQFRIVHFATHGLVTPPRQGCPARPALVTSFGSGDSDGLLTFREIFDLKLDADLVILSACDTAGQASLEATLEAGVTTGGGQALDGLVRAFIASGARDVIASHWPAPDEYDATQRLFSGMFAQPGDQVGQALRRAQIALMNEPATSHPFYWAGFSVIGDGARLLPGR